MTARRRRGGRRGSGRSDRRGPQSAAAARTSRTAGSGRDRTHCRRVREGREGPRGPQGGLTRCTVRRGRSTVEGRRRSRLGGASAPPGPRASRPARRPLPSSVPMRRGRHPPGLRPRRCPRGASCRCRPRPRGAPADRGHATRSRVRPEARPSRARGPGASRRRRSPPVTGPLGRPARSRDLPAQDYCRVSVGERSNPGSAIAAVGFRAPV